MSILIKGMDMPKDIEPGLAIVFANGIDGKRYARLYHYRHGGLTEWLEAVPVPNHGRLIDADELIKPRNQHIDVHSDEWYVEVRTIEDAPTIIEAEE